jgi:hypothetical protein
MYVLLVSDELKKKKTNEIFGINVEVAEGTAASKGLDAVMVVLGRAT